MKARSVVLSHIQHPFTVFGLPPRLMTLSIGGGMAAYVLTIVFGAIAVSVLAMGIVTGWSIQTVTDTGKLFLKNSHKAGTMHVLEVTGKGTLDALRPIKGAIVIAEGYATAATIHDATGRPVVAALDAGNLKAVAEAVRAKYPDREIVIAADNDHANPLGNIGMTKAEEAARAIGGHVVAPTFDAAERAKGLTDFNDLARSRGRHQVAIAIDGALARHREPQRGIA